MISATKEKKYSHNIKNLQKSRFSSNIKIYKKMQERLKLLQAQNVLQDYGVQLTINI